MSDPSLRLISFIERTARWPEVEALTVGQFRVWLEAEIEQNDRALSRRPRTIEERYMQKEAQMDAVALSGASVALRLYMEAMLP